MGSITYPKCPTIMSFGIGPKTSDTVANDCRQMSVDFDRRKIFTEVIKKYKPDIIGLRDIYYQEDIDAINSTDAIKKDEDYHVLYSVRQERSLYHESMFGQKSPLYLAVVMVKKARFENLTEVNEITQKNDYVFAKVREKNTGTDFVFGSSHSAKYEKQYHKELREYYCKRGQMVQNIISVDGMQFLSSSFAIIDEKKHEFAAGESELFDYVPVVAKINVDDKFALNVMTINIGPQKDPTKRRLIYRGIIEDVLPDIIFIQEIWAKTKDITKFDKYYDPIYSVEDSNPVYESAILVKKEIFNNPLEPELHSVHSDRYVFLKVTLKDTESSIIICSYHGVQVQSGVDDDEEKRNLLLEVEDDAKEAGDLPWIIGGDFNLHHCKSTLPSHKRGGGGTGIDYFLFNHDKLDVFDVEQHEFAAGESELFDYVPAVAKIKVGDNFVLNVMAINIGPNKRPIKRRQIYRGIIEAVLPDIIFIQKIWTKTKDITNFKHYYDPIYSVKDSKPAYESAILVKKEIFNNPREPELHSVRSDRYVSLKVTLKDTESSIFICSYHGVQVQSDDKAKRDLLLKVMGKVENEAKNTGDLPWIIGGDFNLHYRKSTLPSHIRGGGRTGIDYFLFNHDKLDVFDVKQYEYDEKEAEIFNHDPVGATVLIKKSSDNNSDEADNNLWKKYSSVTYLRRGHNTLK